MEKLTELKKSCFNSITKITDFVEYLTDLKDDDPKGSVSGFFATNTLLKMEYTVNDEKPPVPSSNLQRINMFMELCRERVEMNIVNETLKATMGGTTPAGIGLLAKNSQISTLLRTEGNTRYKECKFGSALRCYTLAVSYAPKESSFEALAYSNRSACFFEMGNFEKCLADIANFNTVYNTCQSEVSATVVNRLEKRRIKCVEQLKLKRKTVQKNESLKEEIMNMFKLKCPSKAVPAAENFIGIRRNDAKGRHLVNAGKTAILPGTLLMLEEPYSYTVDDAYSFHPRRCRTCLRKLNGGGIPCEGCVFALYCSQDCATSAHHKHHLKYECKMAPFLYEVQMNSQLYLSVMTILKLTQEELLSELNLEPASYPASGKSKKKRAKNSTPKDTDVRYDPSTHSGAVSELTFHEKIRSDGDISYYCMNAVLLTELLDAKTDYFKSLNMETPHEVLRVKTKFAELLLAAQISLPFNAHAHDFFRRDTSSWQLGRPMDKGGLGLFPLLSMANHSCAPNTVSETLPGGVKATIALQHIAPGQELLSCYGGLYTYHRRDARRATMKEGFNFDCNCVACRFDWPTIFGPPPDTPSNSGISICPKCRLTTDVSDSKQLSGLKATVLRTNKGTKICPKCRWSVDGIIMVQELADNYNLTRDLQASARLLREGHGDVVKHYEDWVTYQTYIDGNLLSPSRLNSEALSGMSVTIMILISTLFDLN